jgi:hypothetical protein
VVNGVQGWLCRMVTDLCHAHQRQRHIELRLCEVAVLILIGQRPDLPPRRPTPKLKRPSAHVHLAGCLEVTLCSFRASAGSHKPYARRRLSTTWPCRASSARLPPPSTHKTN